MIGFLVASTTIPVILDFENACPGALMAVFLILPLTLGWLIGISAYIVMLSDIIIEDDGIRLHYLGSWSVKVPWESLGEAEIFRIKLHDPFARPTIAFTYMSLFAVHVPELPLLHKLVGLRCRLGLFPIFFVTPYHDRHELLIARLRQAAIEQGCDPSWLY
jgi:hypothetical protein